MNDKQVKDFMQAKHREMWEELKSWEAAMKLVGVEIPAYNDEDSIKLKSVDYYPDYPVETGWREKILYVLKFMKKGSASEVSERILVYEPYVKTKEDMLTLVSQYLPVMYKDNLLSREKEGKKYIYSIK